MLLMIMRVPAAAAARDREIGARARDRDRMRSRSVRAALSVLARDQLINEFQHNQKLPAEAMIESQPNTRAVRYAVSHTETADQLGREVIRVGTMTVCNRNSCDRRVQASTLRTYRTCLLAVSLANEQANKKCAR